MSDRNSWENTSVFSSAQVRKDFQKKKKPHQLNLSETDGPLIHLCLPRTLKDVHQSKGHLLFALHAQQRLQDGAEGPVVVGDVLGELFVQLHGEDVHGLVAGLDPQRGVDDFGAADPAALGQNAGLDHRVPLLDELPARDAGDGDADKAQICAFLLDYRANSDISHIKITAVFEFRAYRVFYFIALRLFLSVSLYRCKRRLRMVGKLLNSKCSPQKTVSVRGLLVVRAYSMSSRHSSQ